MYFPNPSISSLPNTKSHATITASEVITIIAKGSATTAIITSQSQRKQNVAKGRDASVYKQHTHQKVVSVLQKLGSLCFRVVLTLLPVVLFHAIDTNTTTECVMRTVPLPITRSEGATMSQETAAPSAGMAAVEDAAIISVVVMIHDTTITVAAAFRIAPPSQ